ncbi:uncharacterized protein LOC142974597 isoform X2 [Anticarsia gemmatalis]|uniref:uncharacterized protein LOC142974597 isoform X2 n=1 Tax=Anticarsia gemmatalis TaxID=129554 RepID=UPI003F7767AB
MRDAKEAREAKANWKKLRDSHREALRRRNPENGPSAQTLGKWKYEDEMKFLVPQNTDFTDYESVGEDSNTVFEMETKHDSVQVLVDPLSITKKDLIEDNDERERMRAEKEQHRDEMRQQAFDMNRDDPLSKLFDSLCEKTRELPKYLQLRVQREVFESVSNAEEEAMQLDMVNSSGGNATPASVRKMNRRSVDD